MRYSIDDAFNQDEEFEEEIKYMMKERKLNRADIRICADHPCGENVIYVKGKFAGYIDDAFYSHNMGIDTGMRYFKES